MRSNKINHMDLFTQTANTNYKKHLKTQSKLGLEMIDRIINWDSLMAPIESSLSRAERGRKLFSSELISVSIIKVKLFIVLNLPLPTFMIHTCLITF